MAIATFRDLWSIVALHAPTAPVELVQQWCQSTYDDLCGRRHWSWLRQEGTLTTAAARSLTVTFTLGLNTITSAAGFVASDAGRQIRVGTNTPIYTIDTVTDPSNAVLTTLYGGTSGAATASIQDIYLVMPANFRSFYTVTDMTIQRPIAWWISKERLDLFDPGRIASNIRMRVLASAGLSQATATQGRYTYEAWPYPTSAGSYAMMYFKRTDTLADDDQFLGPLATWTNVLQKGALAEAAKWPGTQTQKNPYFNLPLSKVLEDEYDEILKQVDIADDDAYLMDLYQIDLSKFGLAALSADTTLMRQSDATLADYY